MNISIRFRYKLQNCKELSILRIKKLDHRVTGQDTFTASVSGGLMGGVLTASAILYKNMFSKIQHT